MSHGRMPDDKPQDILPFPEPQDITKLSHEIPGSLIIVDKYDVDALYLGITSACGIQWGALRRHCQCIVLNFK
eukprot:jgi/Botrbrau1/2827/Bobra.0125s0035.1